jgi:3-methyl-2-oxobutanoate hydroxymethyltransferase
MALASPITVPQFRQARQRGQKLTVITAYDFTSAQLSDSAGVDAILVGDSLGTVVQGHKTTLPVSLAQMVYHTSCVVRGVKNALVIADLPFGSYQASPKQAVRSACKLLKAGASAVKLEGGERTLPALKAIVDADIPVMGHIGLTPQSVHQLGGFKVQRDTDRILADAKAIAAVGAFSLVIECVPSRIGKLVTEALTIPTIGIGAGPDCDGQVLVFHDLLGLFDGFRPKFVKRYAELGEQSRTAIREYVHEVRSGAFPAAVHEFTDPNRGAHDASS